MRRSRLQSRYGVELSCHLQLQMSCWSRGAKFSDWKKASLGAHEVYLVVCSEQEEWGFWIGAAKVDHNMAYNVD